MKRKIMIINILIVFLIVSLSMTSAIETEREEETATPLFGIRVEKATKVEEKDTREYDYLGKGQESKIKLPEITKDIATLIKNEQTNWPPRLTEGPTPFWCWFFLRFFDYTITPPVCSIQPVCKLLTTYPGGYCQHGWKIE